MAYTCKKGGTIMQGSIGMPDWEACETCENWGDNGCNLPDINLILHELGDWILCEQYKEREDI